MLIYQIGGKHVLKVFSILIKLNYPNYTIFFNWKSTKLDHKKTLETFYDNLHFIITTISFLTINVIVVFNKKSMLVITPFYQTKK